VGLLFVTTATHEFVVPRSMPRTGPLPSMWLGGERKTVFTCQGTLLGSGELQALRPRVAAFAREHWSWQRCVARYGQLIAASAAPSVRR